jgi:hypothetical protein
LILPPGVEIDVKNPSLPTISEQDTDIMHMVTSGLNKPEDMVTGQTKGDTFSGIKASRGPQADRIHDQIAYFERFLRFDFWRSVFLLKSKVSDFKLVYKIREAVDFKNQEPIFEEVEKEAHELIDFEWPTSEVQDVEGKAGALLGTQHANINEVLGISNETISNKLGFAGYRKERLKNATEEEDFPELKTNAEVNSQQQELVNAGVTNDKTVPAEKDKTIPDPKKKVIKEKTVDK